MASLLEGDVRPPGTPAEPDALTNALYGRAAQPVSQAELASHSTTRDALKSLMPDLVKGAGFAHKGGNQPLTDQTDITLRASMATTELRSAVYEGFNNKSQVVKSFNPGFMSQFGALQTALSAPSVGEQVAQVLGQMNPDLTRSFTAGNLGIGSVSGLTPFNLLAPSD
jgi:hypothetical protein